MKIYKYELGVAGDVVSIKGNFKKFLSVQTQWKPDRDSVVIWAEVDDSYPEKERQIVAIGTGWDIPEPYRDWEYLGTAQVGLHVWHYYGEPMLLIPDSLDERDSDVWYDIFDMFFNRETVNKSNTQEKNKDQEENSIKL